MSSSNNQTYLQTRTTVMSGQLLTEQELHSLLQASLPQLEQQYGLQGISEQRIGEVAQTRLVERGLINMLMNELSVLLRPLGGRARESLVFWSRKFELYNLKALIRGKLNNQPYDEIRESLHLLPPLIGLPHEQLLRTENVPELLRQLERTPYQGIARQARQVYEEKNESFSLDATIDQRYYAGLMKHARNCDEEDRPSMLKLVGSLIDRQNLPWLLRYRFNYRLSPTETYYLMIGSGRRISTHLLKQLVNTQELPQALELLPTLPGFDFSGRHSIMQVELAMNRLLVRECQQCLRLSNSAVARSLAYLILRELDLKQVLAIIQGRIMRLDEGLIRQAIEQRPEALHV